MLNSAWMTWLVPSQDIEEHLNAHPPDTVLPASGLGWICSFFVVACTCVCVYAVIGDRHRMCAMRPAPSCSCSKGKSKSGKAESKGISGQLFAQNAQAPEHDQLCDIQQRSQAADRAGAVCSLCTVDPHFTSSHARRAPHVACSFAQVVGSVDGAA